MLNKDVVSQIRKSPESGITLGVILNVFIIFSAPMPSLKKNGTGAGQRVLGGQPQKLPYQIQITREGFFGEIGHQCGAVLVSPKFVLTAKHCIFEPYSDRIINQNEFALLAGGFISKDPNAQKRRIGRYIPINRSIDPIDPTNEIPYNPDIVMIEVDTPFDINEEVIPACLPNIPAPIGSNCVCKVQLNLPLTEIQVVFSYSQYQDLRWITLILHHQ